MLTPEQERLKTAALAATPGPWTAQEPDKEHHQYHWSVRCPSKPPMISHELCRVSSINLGEAEDAAFIALANPDAILALLDQLEAQEVPDSGPWRAGNLESGVPFIESADFAHDVRLYVNGDFANNEQRAEYCAHVVTALNRTAVPSSVRTHTRATTPPVQADAAK